MAEIHSLFAAVQHYIVNNVAETSWMVLYPAAVLAMYFWFTRNK